jgi:hypothetical protein
MLIAVSRTPLFVMAFALLFDIGRCSFAADSLAAVAPVDTALFLEVPAPDATWQAFEDSELAARWKLTRLSALWLKSPFVERWRTLDQYSSAKTGQPLTQHLRRLFDDGVAIAVVWRDHRPSGVLIARATSAGHVAAAIRAWDKLEPPLRTESRMHAGHAYSVRLVKKAGIERPTYYAAGETRFVLSDQEQLVRECLEHWPASSADDKTPESLNDLPEFRELLPGDRPAALLFVAPRQWQSVLTQLDDGSPGARMVLSGIGKLRGVMARLTLDDGVAAEVTATLDADALSRDWRDFVATANQSPSVIGTAPADAMMVAGGRFAAGPIIAGFMALMPEHDRRELQKVGTMLRTLLLDVDPWAVAVPALLSDWGGYVAVRPATDQEPLRSHPVVAVLSARLPAATRERDLSSGLENALSFGVNALATALIVGKDSRPVTLDRLRDGDVNEWRLTGRPWGEFSLRLSTDAVWWSSSVAELQSVRERNAQTEPSPVARSAQDRFPNAAMFVWLDLRRIRTSETLPALRQLASGKEPPPFAALNELSQVFDELFAAVQLRETQIGVRIGGRTANGP